jgi:uncharacterized protein VirK/YbjX
VESGGKLAEDGNFDLPAMFVPREIATLKVNKRPVYRRRYQMLAEVAGQIQKCTIPVSVKNMVKTIP